MNEPTKELLRLVKSKKLNHGGNRAGVHLSTTRHHVRFPTCQGDNMNLRELLSFNLFLQLFDGTDDGVQFVRCRVCRGHLRVISGGRHLSTHDTDRETYMEEYRLSPDELIALGTPFCQKVSVENRPP